MQKNKQPLSGDELFSYVALAFMLTLMVVGIGYAAWINRPTPTIDTNHNFQVTRIETRNFKEGESLQSLRRLPKYRRKHLHLHRG